MKASLDIPDAELRDVMKFTKAKTKREAIVAAVVEFNRRNRMVELIEYSGTFSDDFPTNEEIEALGIATLHPLRRPKSP